MKSLFVLGSPKAAFIYAACGRYCASMFAAVFFTAFLLFILRLDFEVVKSQMLTAGLLGALTAPVIGWLADSSFVVKKGSLTWLLGGSVASAACLLIMFADPGTTDFPYSTVSSSLWIISFMTSETMFWALTASFSTQSSFRERITSQARAAGILTAGLLMAVCLLALFFYDRQTALNAFKFGAGCSALLLFTSNFFLFSRYGDAPQSGIPNLKEAFTQILKNDQLLCVSGVMMLQQLCLMLSAVAVIAAIMHYKNSGELLIAFAIPAVITQLIAFLTFSKICSVFTRRWVFISSGLIMIAGCVLLAFLKQDDIDSLGGGISAFALVNLGAGWSIASTTVMTADCVEYGEFKFRKRAPCTSFSLQSCVHCLALPFALVIFDAGGRFSSFVYREENTNLLFPSYRITVMFALIAATLMLTVYILAFKLHGKVFENVLHYLEDGRYAQNNKSGYSVHPLRYAINSEAVFCHLKSESTEQVIRLMASKLADINAVNSPKRYLKEIKNKMEKFPAGIAEGLAIPHAIGDFANRPAVAVATLNKPLDFGAADGQKCDLVFMIASPDEANAYISLLGQLSVILNNKKLCDRLRRASESGELIDRIMQCEKHLKF